VDDVLSGVGLGFFCPGYLALGTSYKGNFLT